MNVRNGKSKDVYYAQEQEWIGFPGSIALAGICSFKLTGLSQIQSLSWVEEPPGLKNKYKT